MTVLRPSIQTALIGGIHHSALQKQQLGPEAPACLDQNIKVGLEMLRRIGLGREPTQLKEPVRSLALAKDLTEEAWTEEPDAYMQKNAPVLTHILYALWNEIPLAESRQILGGITVFDEDPRITALLRSETVEPASTGVKPTEVDTTLNLLQFENVMGVAVQAWTEWHISLVHLPADLSAQDTAMAAVQEILQLLGDNPAVRKVMNLYYVNPEQLKGYPINISQEQIGVYLENRESFDHVLNNMLKGFLTQDIAGELKDDDWQQLWRSFWTQAIEAAEQGKHEEDETAVAILKKFLEQAANAAGYFNWSNLWGLFRRS